LDSGWTLTAAILVFFMQAGFALVEAGNVRNKNTLSILVKNLIDCAVGATGWFLLGYGLAFGTDNVSADDGGGFVGTDNYAVMHDDLKTTDGSIGYVAWFFQFTFCATGATIVSGSLAERAKLEGYCIFSFFMCLFIYPIVVHWTWGGGWLYTEGYNDFAGSGVVHLTGGATALYGAAILGPRSGRFDADADEEAKREFLPGSVLSIVLGTFVLWFGWFGFNGGSTCGLTGGSAEVAAHACSTTTLAGACGGVTCFLLSSKMAGKFDIPAFANGILGGLVGITAPCSNCDMGAALIIGVVSGIIVPLSMKLLEKLKIDDPISASPVHGFCGVWGLIATGLFDLDVGIVNGGALGDCLGPNLLGALAIIGWTAACSIPLFLALNTAGLLRVTEAMEIQGLDNKFVRSPHSAAMAQPASKKGGDLEV
jgi:Amt family ammonium transporter